MKMTFNQAKNKIKKTISSCNHYEQVPVAVHYCRLLMKTFSPVEMLCLNDIIIDNHVTKLDELLHFF